MKNLILTLFAVALSIGAMAQTVRTEGPTLNLIYQGPDGARNTVKMIQTGNTKLEITQDGGAGEVRTFQDLNGDDDLNTVLIKQLGSDNTIETDQSGTSNAIISTQGGVGNTSSIVQTGISNTATLSQSGNGNSFEIEQSTTFGTINLTQSGTVDAITIIQGVSNVPSADNVIDVTQANAGPTGSTIVISQLGSSNRTALYQDGGLNTLNVTQSGETNRIIGLVADNSQGTQMGASNTAILKQTGEGNTIRFSQEAMNTSVDVLQSGNGNLARVVVGALI